MQTFLPYESYKASAKVLDYRRLGKQRVETKQILNALLGKSKGWVNHPATVMWRGFEMALCTYGLAVCNEWILRGYNDSVEPWLCEVLEDLKRKNVQFAYPKWTGLDALYASHRSNLLTKDPRYYSQFAWAEPPGLPYVWPNN